MIINLLKSLKHQSDANIVFLNVTFISLSTIKKIFDYLLEYSEISYENLSRNKLSLDI